MIGGASTDPDKRAFGQQCGWVAARDLPQLIVDILSHYTVHAEEGHDFTHYFNKSGKDALAALCNRYNDRIPDCATDESYYFDWGATEEFTTAHMGHGECSAGIYDMIEVAMNNIKETIDRMNKGDKGPDTERMATDLVNSAAGMLLVTRGVDPSTEREMYLEFTKSFLDAGLVDEEFRPLVSAALRNDAAFLAENIALAEKLGKTMIQLYHSMDNRLRFKCEADITEPIPPGVLKNDQIPPHMKDLRGIACPMNFVKTKVELAKLKTGEQLCILLDDGEPIDNVPRSVTTEGHAIIVQERQENHWRVIIEKRE